MNWPLLITECHVGHVCKQFINAKIVRHTHCASSSTNTDILFRNLNEKNDINYNGDYAVIIKMLAPQVISISVHLEFTKKFKQKNWYKLGVAVYPVEPICYSKIQRGVLHTVQGSSSILMHVQVHKTCTFCQI